MVDIYTSIVIYMPRPPTTPAQKAAGEALGAALVVARGSETAGALARRTEIPLDTLRKVEKGAIAAPGFFLVAHLARALDLSLDTLANDLGQAYP